MRKHGLSLVVVVATALSLYACSSNAPRPTSELALAVSALKNAENAGAREYAPIELRDARQKMEAAETAMEEEKFAKARYLSIEAQVDADLARAKADAEKSEVSLKRVQDNLKTVRSDSPPAVQLR